VAIARLYGRDLVTRHTGRVVRCSIENLLAESGGLMLTVLDFSDVALIDFSCADEVVAKLILGSLPEANPPAACYFLFRGIDERHVDPIESVLRRRGLAICCERVTGEPLLLGDADPGMRRAWELVWRSDRLPADAVAVELNMGLDEARELLCRMHARRLVLREGEAYTSLPCALREAAPPPDPA